MSNRARASRLMAVLLPRPEDEATARGKVFLLLSLLIVAVGGMAVAFWPTSGRIFPPGVMIPLLASFIGGMLAWASVNAARAETRHLRLGGIVRGMLLTSAYPVAITALLVAPIPLLTPLRPLIREMATAAPELVLAAAEALVIFVLLFGIAFLAVGAALGAVSIVWSAIFWTAMLVQRRAGA